LSGVCSMGEKKVYDIDDGIITIKERNTIDIEVRSTKTGKGLNVVNVLNIGDKFVIYVEGE